MQYLHSRSGKHHDCRCLPGVVGRGVSRRAVDGEELDAHAFRGGVEEPEGVV